MSDVHHGEALEFVEAPTAGEVAELDRRKHAGHGQRGGGVDQPHLAQVGAQQVEGVLVEGHARTRHGVSLHRRPCFVQSRLSVPLFPRTSIARL